MANWIRSPVVLVLSVLCVAVTVLGTAEDFDESDVVVLGASNFTDFVKSKKYVLAEFYAPWCGHCQTLAPEYAKAATILKADDVSLVKVDATQNPELSQQYEVRGFPTLFYFVDGVHRPYSGGRSTEEIVGWVKKKSGPPVQTIKSTTEAEKLLKVETPIAVAYFESLEDEHAKEYVSAASKEEGVMFYMTDDAEVAEKFGLDKKTPSLVLLKKQTEKRVIFDDVVAAFSEISVRQFVLENKLPLVTTFSRETAPSIFESEINKQLLLFASPEEYEKIRTHYEEAAKSFKGWIIFVLVDVSNREIAAPVLEFFSLSGAETKLMGFIPEETGLKYAYEGDYSFDSIKEFSGKFLGNNLSPYYKSDPVPEENDEDVKIVVGKNFEDIVLDESKDVLLEVYAPWCGHCQSLEPEYNKLAEAVKDVKSLVIAKMDGTKNEHARVKIEGFPTILLFRAGNKTEDPIQVQAQRTASGLAKFLSTNVAIPFEAPDLPEDPTPSHAADGEDDGESEFDYEKQLGELEENQDATETEEVKDEL